MFLNFEVVYLFFCLTLENCFENLEFLQIMAQEIVCNVFKF
jgi:hypothetical protein